MRSRVRTPGGDAHRLTGERQPVYRVTAVGRMESPSQPGWPIALSDQEAALTRQVPGWFAWRTGDGHWAVMPERASSSVFTTDDPAEVKRKARNGASWLPAAIREAREKLDSLPAHWEPERATWTRQLQALERAHQRATAPPAT